MLIFNTNEVRDYLHLFLDHYTRLSKDDRYYRFLNTMSPEAIRNWLMKLDESQYNHTFFIDQREDVFAGVAQLAINHSDNTADIAISVLPEWRRNKIATHLIQQCIEVAKNSGIKSVHYECHKENYGCRSTLKSLGFTFNYIDDCIVGSIILN